MTRDHQTKARKARLLRRSSIWGTVSGRSKRGVHSKGLVSGLVGSCFVCACVSPGSQPSEPSSLSWNPEPFGAPPTECRKTDSLCVRFRNDIGADFRVASVVVAIDNGLIWVRPGAQVTPDVVAWSGSSSGNEQALQLVVKLRGAGTGLYAYLNAYKFDVKASHAFRVPKGKRLVIDVVAYERGSARTPLEQRPALKFDERPDPQ